MKEKTIPICCKTTPYKELSTYDLWVLDLAHRAKSLSKTGKAIAYLKEHPNIEKELKENGIGIHAL